MQASRRRPSSPLTHAGQTPTPPRAHTHSKPGGHYDWYSTNEAFMSQVLCERLEHARAGHTVLHLGCGARYLYPCVSIYPCVSMAAVLALNDGLLCTACSLFLACCRILSCLYPCRTSMHLCIYPYLCTCIYLSIRIYVHVSIYGSIYLSIHSSIHLCMYVCMCVFIYPYIYLSTSLSMSVHVCITSMYVHNTRTYAYTES